MDGRGVWEYAFGYSKRNLLENAMFRFKPNIGANCVLELQKDKMEK